MAQRRNIVWWAFLCWSCCSAYLLQSRSDREAWELAGKHKGGTGERKERAGEVWECPWDGATADACSIPRSQFKSPHSDHRIQHTASKSAAAVEALRARTGATGVLQCDNCHWLIHLFTPKHSLLRTRIRSSLQTHPEKCLTHSNSVERIISVLLPTQHSKCFCFSRCID